MVLPLFSLIVPSSYVITMPVCGFYVVFRIVLMVYIYIDLAILLMLFATEWKLNSNELVTSKSVCLISICNILDNEGHSAVLQVAYGCKIFSTSS